MIKMSINRINYSRDVYKSINLKMSTVEVAKNCFWFLPSTKHGKLGQVPAWFHVLLRSLPFG